MSDANLKPPQENPLTNILVNVLVPIVAPVSYTYLTLPTNREV